MTNKMTLIRIAAIVTALDDTQGSSESMLYIFCNMDMSAYQTIRDILKSSGIITIRGNWVTLTEKGIQFAADINATLKQNKEATK